MTSKDGASVRTDDILSCHDSFHNKMMQCHAKNNNNDNNDACESSGWFGEGFETQIRLHHLMGWIERQVGVWWFKSCVYQTRISSKSLIGVFCHTCIWLAPLIRYQQTTYNHCHAQYGFFYSIWQFRHSTISYFSVYQISDWRYSKCKLRGIQTTSTTPTQILTLTMWICLSLPFCVPAEGHLQWIVNPLSWMRNMVVTSNFENFLVNEFGVTGWLSGAAFERRLVPWSSCMCSRKYQVHGICAANNSKRPLWQNLHDWEYDKLCVPEAAKPCCTRGPSFS